MRRNLHFVKRPRIERLVTALLIFPALMLAPFNELPARAQGTLCAVNCAPSVIALKSLPRAAYTRRASKEALKWADEELRRMSLDEKIGQLISVGLNAKFMNRESDEYRALLRQVEVNHVGGIILFRGPVYE
ncbi:MAG: hypothetical protein WCD76_16955, partial [Pyrinomonadaceae bacterium]